MRLRSCLPVLATLSALGACDVTQELQGASGPDGSVSPGTDGGGGGDKDGSTVLPDGGGSDALPTRQTSICTPRSGVGTTSVVVTGAESAYFSNVTDIATGADRVFALSQPWTFVGVPLTGPSVAVSYDVSATLPNFVALGVAPTGTNPTGTLSASALARFDLPVGGGQLVALRGPSGSTASEIQGRVVVDGDDVYYFQKSAPSRLVHAATKSNAAEQLLVEYPTASNEVVTAAAVVGTYVYFASIVVAGGRTTSNMLRRVPKTGGAVEDVVSVATYGQVESIHVDGTTLYLTPGGEVGSVSDGFGIYSLATSTLGSGALQGSGDNVAYARSTGVTFDGTSFYYGSSPGQGCVGRLARVSKTTALTHVGNAEILATNLDRPVRVRAIGGAVYLGTAGDPFYKPVGYPGQMLRWTP